MNIDSLRDKKICVSTKTYNGLRALAEMEHRGCLDELAEAWLAEKLASDPRHVRRNALFTKLLKELDAAMDAEFGEQLQ